MTRKTGASVGAGRGILQAAWRAGLAMACAWGLVSAPAGAQALDPARSHFEFELKTRWGQAIVGQFPRYEGEVTVLPDGRHEVRIRLAADSVEVDGPQRYTRFARGDRFLDAARHPWVEFRSEPYAGELVRGGGPLHGTLSMHGVSRREVFVLAPSECARPARDCDVLVKGHVLRTDYGLESWRWALINDVNFRLRVRLKDETP